MKIPSTKEELKKHFKKSNAFFSPMIKGMILLVFIIYFFQFLMH
jgi:hypothetical protein